MKFDQLHDGEWTRPIKKGYKIKCCRCGLVHTLDFRTVKRGNGISVEFRASRQKRRARA